MPPIAPPPRPPRPPSRGRRQIARATISWLEQRANDWRKCHWPPARIDGHERRTRGDQSTCAVDGGDLVIKRDTARPELGERGADANHLVVARCGVKAGADFRH